MSQTFEPGTILDEKYQVERELGSGGMGLVILAMHLGLEERVAIKMLLPDALNDTEAVSRFAREAKAAARIKSEHVARVLDVSSLEAGKPYMVMEYLEGSDLEQITEAQGPLSIEDAVDYVLQACEALAEAHARGIVHRDLKPGNLHLSKRADGSPLVKVLDFGISKFATRDNSGSVTTTSALLGSPLYMSPEQMKATRDVDARTDIWAMGVVLYEFLTCASPFTAPTMPQVCARVLDTDPDPISEDRIPPGLFAVITKCLEKKPGDRFQDVSAFAQALEPFAPARSKISIERIANMIESPPSDTAMRVVFATSPAAPTLPESAIAPVSPPPRATPLPPQKSGSETFASATISAPHVLGRPRSTMMVYGASAFAFVLGLFFFAQANGRQGVATTAQAKISSAPVTAARIDAGTWIPAEAPTASAVTFAVTAPTTMPRDAAKQSTSPPHPHKKPHDLSQYFGGRD